MFVIFVVISDDKLGNLEEANPFSFKEFLKTKNLSLLKEDTANSRLLSKVTLGSLAVTCGPPSWSPPTCSVPRRRLCRWCGESGASEDALGKLCGPPWLAPSLVGRRSFCVPASSIRKRGQPWLSGLSRAFCCVL